MKFEVTKTKQKYMMKNFPVPKLTDRNITLETNKIDNIVNALIRKFNSNNNWTCFIFSEVKDSTKLMFNRSGNKMEPESN